NLFLQIYEDTKTDELADILTGPKGVKYSFFNREKEIQKRQEQPKKQKEQPKKQQQQQEQPKQTEKKPKKQQQQQKGKKGKKGKGMVKIITDPNQLIERMNVLVGSLHAGNNSDLVKNE